VNADPPTFVVRLRPEPNAADPLKALRWILRTSQQQFGLQCLDIREEESESPAGGNPPLPAFAETSRRREDSPPRNEFSPAGDDLPISRTPAPIVPVTRDGRTLVVNCPFCGRKHWHGDAGRTERGRHGNRVAHCRRPPTPGATYDLVECATPVTYVRAVK
jgi:hypothetical protein